MTGKELKEYFILNIKKSKDFRLKASSKKSQKNSIEFQVTSKKIREKLRLHKNTKNLFSFITNSTYLLFYIKKNHTELLTPEMKKRFSKQYDGLNSSGEFKIIISSKYDIIDLIQLLFINKLKSGIQIIENSTSNQQLETEIEKLKILKTNKLENVDNSKKQNENLKQNLEIYQQKKTIDLESLVEFKNEIDYIKNHRKLMEIGELAEKIVLESEIEFLKPDYLELSKGVRLVSNNPKLGFDVLSFETDGKQKQIEVKAISENKNTKSFIITQNELSKSKIYANYYVYCVTELNSDKPKILRIKNPDFENNGNFLIEPLTYKITFE